MIAKITYGSSVAGCAEYDIDKAKDARVIAANGLPLTTDIEQIQTLFNIQASLSSRVEKPVMHIALSFSPADGPRLEVSPMLARNIIESYLDRMGLADAQYIATQHRNTEHPHYHILVDRVFADGSVYKTGFERSRSVKACRAITEAYGLTMGQGRDNVKVEALKEPDRSRQILYREISYALNNCRDHNEFINILARRGVQMYSRKKDGRVVGFSFKRNDTCRMGGSKISRNFSARNLIRTLHSIEMRQREEQQNRHEHQAEHQQPTIVIPRFDGEDKSLERDIRRKKEIPKKKRGMHM